MCGIAGIVTWKDAAAELRLDRMTASLAHRGPDDSGSVAADGVYLGHRRLTIIDLSANGHQPMSNEDGSIWITYNGEVYDTGPTRERLESRGHSFRSHTDTEVIVHLYEEEGTALWPYLNGMFAFALHDRRQRRLLLARDRLGIKPLFYTFRDGEFLFGSELKAIFAGLGYRPSLRADALGQYLLEGYATAPDTVFEGIYLLPPGHYLNLSLDDLAAGRMPESVEYWDAAFTGDDSRPAEEIEGDLEAVLADAVRMRMVADVPLGAFLSGGIDSSSIVALMARASTDPVRTFTVDVPGTTYSEREKALAVAEKYKTEHVVTNSTDHGAEDYWKCMAHFDAPFNCPSLLNTWLVSRAAREHVTVALSGDGGDELFGGYDRYQDIARPRRTFVGQGLLQTLGDRLPDDLRGRARLVDFGKDDFLRIFTMRHPVSVKAAETLVGVSLQPWVDRMRAIHERYPADRITRALYFDLKTYLPDQILAKVDSASMAVSLEVRVPILDFRVVELAGRIPSALKVRPDTSKWILKRIAQRLLPEALIEQAKVGFDPPLSSWVFTARMDQRLSELARPEARFRQVLNGRPVDGWIRDVSSDSSWRVPRRAALWGLYQLEQWMQMGDTGRADGYRAVTSGA
ncbi:MAG: asparagine synthase (glutamine-hydrolyzing) [Pyrinomonadaceae bacterium]